MVLIPSKHHIFYFDIGIWLSMTVSNAMNELWFVSKHVQSFFYMWTSEIHNTNGGPAIRCTVFNKWIYMLFSTYGSVTQSRMWLEYSQVIGRDWVAQRIHITHSHIHALHIEHVYIRIFIIGPFINWKSANNQTENRAYLLTGWVHFRIFVEIFKNRKNTHVLHFQLLQSINLYLNKFDVSHYSEII